MWEFNSSQLIFIYMASDTKVSIGTLQKPQQTVARKNSLLTEKNLEQDQAHMQRGVSYTIDVQLHMGGGGRQKRGSYFLKRTLPEVEQGDCVNPFSTGDYKTAAHSPPDHTQTSQNIERPFFKCVTKLKSEIMRWNPT